MSKLRTLAFLLLVLPLRADITGIVTLSGKPGSEDETFVAKASGCGESPVRRTENWKIGPKGEMQDVVVWIVDPKIAVPVNFPPQTPTVTQIGCRYVPHITILRAGMPLTIVNADPTLHNVHAKVYGGPDQPLGDDVFNFGQGRRGQTDQYSFEDPGIYSLQCDVHAWMQCWVMVLPKALLPECATTDADGKFKILNGEMVADGDYKIRAWHPRFADMVEQTIHVKNGAASVILHFDGAKSF